MVADTNTQDTQNPRERLLQTASQLFYAHGVSRVGINEVIRAAGIARMTLYYHFSSKEELVREVLRLRVRKWQEWLVQAVESRASEPREQLLAVFDVLDDLFSTPDFRGCSALKFSADATESDAELGVIAQGHKAFVLDYLEALARRLPCRQPAELARGLLLLQNGATVLAHLGGETYHPGDARRAATKLIDAHVDGPAHGREGGPRHD